MLIEQFPGPRFRPDIDDVRDYIALKGFHFSAEEFINYYDRFYWTGTGGKPIANWMACELEFIEDCINELQDHELRAIIRAHYLLGDSWPRCTQRILNYESGDAAKKRVYRYFGIIR